MWGWTTVHGAFGHSPRGTDLLTHVSGWSDPASLTNPWGIQKVFPPSLRQRKLIPRFQRAPSGEARGHSLDH
jgi:hypothetical protein